MLEKTNVHKRVNLGTCPDHYAMQPHGSKLEVIETAGNSPLPTQFFLKLDCEAEIEEPRDASYPFQTVGAASLANGCNIGGIRHQFRDTEKGLEARFCVEFPRLCPDSLIKEHQLHLAAEWSRWITWCKEHKEWNSFPEKSYQAMQKQPTAILKRPQQGCFSSTFNQRQS